MPLASARTSAANWLAATSTHRPAASRRRMTMLSGALLARSAMVSVRVAAAGISTSAGMVNSRKVPSCHLDVVTPDLCGRYREHSRLRRAGGLVGFGRSAYCWSMRVHVVSDVHGRTDALRRASDGADALICLGDLLLFLDYADHTQGIFADLFGAQAAGEFIALRNAQQFDAAREYSPQLSPSLPV